MFNEEFFPTPKEVIKKMLEPYKSEYHGYSFGRGVILEPSAGKGDILDFIKKKTYHSNAKFYCIESNVDLQAILSEKHHKLIDTDFLTHEPDFDYDYIFMNPPFSNGDEHLLKAWEILRDGEIVCLLNEETIKNPYTKKRELLKSIIDANGSVEFLGDCFSDAERKTGVNVALVRLKKVAKEKRFSFDGFNDRENIAFDENFTESNLANSDALENICVQYNQVKKDYEKMLVLQNKIRQYKNNLTGSDFSLSCAKNLGEHSEKKFLDFVEELKMEIWRNIAKQTNIEKYMTSKTQNDFSSYLREQGDLAITKENIINFVKIIFENRFNILDRSIVELFDTFTKFYKENRCHMEGWKVNKKVILPYVIDLGYDGFFRGNYSHHNKMADIDKTLCYISGKEFSEIDQLGECIKNVKIGDRSLHESEFFHFRCYKKGTIHLTFKDK